MPLPLAVICEVMGISGESKAQVGAWSEALCPTLDPVVSEETVQVLDCAVLEFGEFLMDYARSRSLNPGDDLLSVLATAWKAGQISSGELVATGVLLLAAGHETSSNLVASGMLSLLRSPDELQLVRDAPSLAPRAVDEMLRTESPIQMFMRWATDDCEVGERVVRAGDQVAVHIGAANRDPAAFQDPESFRVERPENRHLAFGSGIHACVGAALARSEAEVAVRVLLKEFSHIELVEEPAWKETVTVRGPKALMISAAR